ncbi:MAG: DUF2225 domain-containing protein [Sarcina sp.]
MNIINKEHLQFNSIANIDLYNLLFDKTIYCPVCENLFKARTIRAKTARILEKDSDFFLRYKTINPYFYDVLICPSCGYSALKIDFDKIHDKQKELVKIYITPRWNHKNFLDIYDINVALERYKLALITASTINKKNSTKAMICLKIAWMYRLLEDSKSEQIFLEKALSNFELAFFNEQLPVYEMQKTTLLYLIGELHRRLGNLDIALKNFSEVLTDQTAPHKLKELSRDMSYLIKNKP